jgi:DNA-binding transcriptional ArsR family regulator
MVEHRLDEVFQALGHATRRAMLADLSLRERTVGQLGEPFAISFAAASKHVKVLERAGLVERTVAGRTHVCRLAPEPIAEAHRWLGSYQRFWQERLDALEAELRREDEAS